MQCCSGAGNETHPIFFRYAVASFAGLLIASFMDGFYSSIGSVQSAIGQGSSGRLIFYLYEFFLGSYADYWYYNGAILFVPLLVVNTLNYCLYRRSEAAGEQLFFLLLAVVLNALVIFSTTNILMLYFV